MQTSNTDSSLLDDALRLAALGHYGQRDKLNRPYILHPLAVMTDPELTTDTERTVAVLHDTLEDTHITAEMLLKVFGEEITNAVVALTHFTDEDRVVYYKRVRANPLALKVKLADIRHNTCYARMEYLPYSESNRLMAKYTDAVKHLLGDGTSNTIVTFSNARSPNRSVFYVTYEKTPVQCK